MSTYRTRSGGTRPEIRVLPPPRGAGRLLAVPVLIGSLVAVSFGAYGSLHEPTGVAVNVAGFSDPLAAKSWLTTGALAFVLLQLLSAVVMYDRMPGIPPTRWIGGVHRWSGRIAFVLVILVAIHCLYALGFQVAQPRALVHSVLGCLFFGVFIAKMLGLRKEGLPGWVLPTIGGLLFTVLIGIWLSSSLWFFSTSGFKV